MGSSLPLPFYSILFTQYTQTSGNTITENGLSSGSGIRSLRDKIIDFASVDAILTEQEMSEFGSEVLAIPTCLGAIVLAYNLPGVTELRLNPDIIADIFLKKIKFWNDPTIQTLNPDVRLPATDITTIHRSDGSGSSYIFTDYLCKVSPEWKEKMGKGHSIRWKSGISVGGNTVASATIKQVDGSIGYIGAEHASMLKLPTIAIRNASGKYVKATAQSIQIAAETDYPDGKMLSITNSPHEDAYPISCFSWFLVYKNQAYAKRGPRKSEMLKEFLFFALAPQQQKIAATMAYVPLPEEIANKARKQIESIEWNPDER